MKDDFMKNHPVGTLIVIEGQFYRVVYLNKKTGNNMAMPLTKTEYEELMDFGKGIDRKGAWESHSFERDDDVC